MLKGKLAKISTVLLAVTLSASMFAGCGNSSSGGAQKLNAADQVVRYNLGAEPKTIDPALNDAVDGATVVTNCFEGLMRLDSKDQPVAGVAEKYEMTSDGLKYTFHLRKNAVWSDGKPVKAQDFEYAWKRALNPDTAANYAYYMFVLKNGEAYNGGKAKAEDVGVKALDDATLEVNLEYPAAYFLSLAAFPTFAPVRQDVVEANKTGWATKPETYICNGPFKLSAWLPKDTLTIVKNDKYWDAGRIKLQKVEMKMIDQETSSLAAFKTGQLDLIDLIPQQELPKLLADGTAKNNPYLGTYYIDLNVSDKLQSQNPAAAKALSDVRVRKALSLALNRKEIVEKVAQGGQLPATAFVPKGIPDGKSGKDFASKDYYPAEGDVAQAQKLLADAGYPNGQGFPKLTYLYNTGTGHQNIAQAVQEMWRKNLGINIELQNQEWQVFQKTRTDKQYEIARGGWIADYVDPSTFTDLLTSKSGNNEPGYNSPAYDAKIAAAQKETDVTKRMQLLHDAEDILMNDMPLIPIYFYTNPTCTKPYVIGARKSQLGFVYFDNAYVDKSVTK
jgi:oligopeptide transport system substrate-binding protein